MPPPIAPLHPETENVEEVLKGIGEIAIYHYPSDVLLDKYPNQKLED